MSGATVSVDHHAQAPQACSPGGLDELLLLQGQGLAADDAAHGQPLHRADGHEDQQDVRPEGHHQQDDEEDEGQGVEDIDDPHHGLVHHPPEIAGGRPPGDTDQERDEGGHQADRQGDPQAHGQARQKVPAQGVGPQQVAVGQGRDPDVRLIDLVVGPGGQGRAQQGEEGQEDQHHQAGGGGPVGEQSGDSVIGQAAAAGGRAPNAQALRSRRGGRRS